MGRTRKHLGCKVSGCEKKHLGKGYCQKHLRQMKKHGKIMPDRKFHTGCRIPGCKAKHFARGYCLKHDRQIRKHGKILPDRKKYFACQVPGCRQKHHSGGYCQKHYNQIWRRGVILADREKQTKCQAPGCDKKYYSKGYCQRHYEQITRLGKLLDRPLWKPNDIILKENCAEICLRDIQGKLREKAIIDKGDSERVKGYPWSWGQSAVQTIYNGKRVSLGKFILNITTPRKIVIYKNKNVLDCRKSNLIAGTNQQAGINKRLQSNNTSGHKGVYWKKASRKWQARLVLDRRTYSGGSYEKKADAIKARKELEAIYHNHLKF